MTIAYSVDRGFSSFRAFKSWVGAAGEDMQWHHIVERERRSRKGGRASEDPCREGGPKPKGWTKPLRGSLVS